MSGLQPCYMEGTPRGLEMKPLSREKLEADKREDKNAHDK